MTLWVLTSGGNPMNDFLKMIEKFYLLITSEGKAFLDKKTAHFEEEYELHHNEKPSSLITKKFRKDYVLKQGIITFLLITILYFTLTN